MGQDTCGGRHEDNMGLGSLFTTRVPGVTQVLRRSPLPPRPPAISLTWKCAVSFCMVQLSMS